jgi:hypothetical protein
MNSSMIVEQFDVTCNIGGGLLSGRIRHVMNSFILQAGKNDSASVVPTLTGPPDRMPQTKSGQFLPVLADDMTA